MPHDVVCHASTRRRRCRRVRAVCVCVRLCQRNATKYFKRLLYFLGKHLRIRASMHPDIHTASAGDAKRKQVPKMMKHNIQMIITRPPPGLRSSSWAHPIQIDHPGAHGTIPDRFRAVPDDLLMKTLFIFKNNIFQTCIFSAWPRFGFEIVLRSNSRIVE